MPSVQHGRGKRRGINEINMVPFIDVMLVLLIIFMVTAPLMTPGTIELPSIGNAARQAQDVVHIVVQRDESLTIKDGQGETSATLSNVARLVQRNLGKESRPVVISADRNVRYEVVVKVMDTLQRAGVQRIGLSVQLAPASSS